MAPRTPWLDTATSQPLARKARSSLAGYASSTGTPPRVLPCPEPNTPLSPKATILIVSAFAGAEAAEDRTNANAKAAQCHIAFPTHSSARSRRFRARIALLTGLGNGESPSLIVPGSTMRPRVVPDQRRPYCAMRSASGHQGTFPRPRPSARCRFSQPTFAGNAPQRARRADSGPRRPQTRRQ